MIILGSLESVRVVDFLLVLIERFC